MEFNFVQYGVTYKVNSLEMLESLLRKANVFKNNNIYVEFEDVNGDSHKVYNSKNAIQEIKEILINAKRYKDIMEANLKIQEMLTTLLEKNNTVSEVVVEKEVNNSANYNNNDVNVNDVNNDDDDIKDDNNNDVNDNINDDVKAMYENLKNIKDMDIELVKGKDVSTLMNELNETNNYQYIESDYVYGAFYYDKELSRLVLGNIVDVLDFSDTTEDTFENIYRVVEILVNGEAEHIDSTSSDIYESPISELYDMVDTEGLIEIMDKAISISKEFTTLNKLMKDNNLESINIENLFDKDQREYLIEKIESLDSRRRGVINKHDKFLATEIMSYIGCMADKCDYKEVSIDIIHQIESNNYNPKIKDIVDSNKFYDSYRYMVRSAEDIIDADIDQRILNIESYINMDAIERQKLYEDLVELYEDIEYEYDDVEAIAMGCRSYSMTHEGESFRSFLNFFKTILKYDEPNLDIYYKIENYELDKYESLINMSR